MLEITIPDRELINNKTNEIINVKGVTLQLEHSLISIKKWEANWHKPFLNKQDKTIEEIKDYIKCMTLNKNNIDHLVYDYMPTDAIKIIVDYIKDPMIAPLYFSNDDGTELGTGQANKREAVTAEIIYYWMIACNIPFECQKWHLNQLITLIKIINLKNAPPKKMDPKQEAARRRAINTQRRAKWNTKG